MVIPKTNYLIIEDSYILINREPRTCKIINLVMKII